MTQFSLLFEHGRFAPSTGGLCPVIVLDFLVALPIAQETESSKGFVNCDVGQVQYLLQV